MSNIKVQQNLNELFNVDPIPDDQYGATFGNQKPNVDEVQNDVTDGQLVPVDQDQWRREDEQIKNDVDSDYRKIKSNLETLLANSETMLDLAMQIAQGTESAKSIDSVAKLIGQIADINTRIIDLNAKKQDVFIKARPKVNTKFAEALNGETPMIGNVTNNTMFVGSVTDLLKQIKQAQNDVIDVKESS